VQIIPHDAAGQENSRLARGTNEASARWF